MDAVMQAIARLHPVAQTVAIIGLAVVCVTVVVAIWDLFR